MKSNKYREKSKINTFTPKNKKQKVVFLKTR